MYRTVLLMYVSCSSLRDWSFFSSFLLSAWKSFINSLSSSLCLTPGLTPTDDQRCRAAQETAAFWPQRAAGEQQCPGGKLSLSAVQTYCDRWYYVEYITVLLLSCACPSEPVSWVWRHFLQIIIIQIIYHQINLYLYIRFQTWKATQCASTGKKRIKNNYNK